MSLPFLVHKLAQVLLHHHTVENRMFYWSLEVKPPILEKKNMSGVSTEHEADMMEVGLFVSAFHHSSVASSSHMNLKERDKHEERCKLKPEKIRK